MKALIAALRELRAILSDAPWDCVAELDFDLRA